MKEMNLGKFVLVLVFLSFVAFPLAGAVEAFLLTQSEAPNQMRLLISGICILMAIPLFIVVLLNLRQLRR